MVAVGKTRRWTSTPGSSATQQPYAEAKSPNLEVLKRTTRPNRLPPRPIPPLLGLLMIAMQTG